MTQEKQEDLFGTQFQFKCRGFTYVYLYNKQRYKVVGEDRWYGIDEDCARKAVANGHWTILPSTPKQPTSTPKQFDEETFKAAEQIVSEALRPTVKAVAEDSAHGVEHIKKLVADLEYWIGCMSYNDSYFGEPEGMLKKTVRALTHSVDKLEPADNMLDIIKKACTASQGRIVVQVNKDGYAVFHHYFYVDSVKVEDESNLKVFLEALCLVDSMDSWENFNG